MIISDSRRPAFVPVPNGTSIDMRDARDIGELACAFDAPDAAPPGRSVTGSNRART